MTEQESRLLDWTGSVAGDPTRVRRLGELLLHDVYGPRLPATPSSLNNDGSPLQVCITFGGRTSKVRIIGDPSAHVSAPARRFVVSRQVLSKVLELTASQCLREACDETLGRILPVRYQGEPPDGGLFWLAAGLTGGAALYVNTRWGDLQQRWNDTWCWLAKLLPAVSQADTVFRSLRRYGHLASVGIEGSRASDIRLKIYWRLKKPTCLDQLGVSLLAEPVFADFLRHIVGRETLALSGIVFSVGFLLYDGQLCDAKVDLCAHCIQKDPSSWAETLTAVSDDCLISPDVVQGIIRQHCEVAFVGFGLGRDQCKRLNLYLKAPIYGR